MLSNPGGSVQWPMRRRAHSSVLINNSTGPHLLVVGGLGARDSWLFDINKRIWKRLVSIIIQYNNITVLDSNKLTNALVCMNNMNNNNVCMNNVLCVYMCVQYNMIQ